jgi:hypothetical protein
MAREQAVGRATSAGETGNVGEKSFEVNGRSRYGNCRNRSFDLGHGCFRKC